MSDSPWSGKEVFKQIQTEIKRCRELQDGMLTLDESGDERAGRKSAGATRQYFCTFEMLPLAIVVQHLVNRSRSTSSRLKQSVGGSEALLQAVRGS